MSESDTVKGKKRVPVEAPMGDESIKVKEWREFRFNKLGFSDIASDYLASTKIDLNDMEMLLKDGCPHQTAIRILAGTCFLGDDPSAQWPFTFELEQEAEHAKVKTKSVPTPAPR